MECQEYMREIKLVRSMLLGLLKLKTGFGVCMLEK